MICAAEVELSSVKPPDVPAASVYPTELLALLAKVNVPNQLLTIPGGKHGGFTAGERTRIYVAIREFLAKNGLGKT